MVKIMRLGFISMVLLLLPLIPSPIVAKTVLSPIPSPTAPPSAYFTNDVWR